MTILTANLSSMERIEPVIYGSLTESPHSFLNIGGKYLNCSLLRVPAFGAQRQEASEVLEFEHSEIPQQEEQIIYPGIYLNGQLLGFKAKSRLTFPKPFDIIQADCRKNVGQGVSLIFKMFIYKFQSGIFKFELGVFCESLESDTVAFNEAQTLTMNFPHEFFMRGGFYNVGRIGLTDTIVLPRMMIDGQGVYLDGAAVDFSQRPSPTEVAGLLHSRLFAVDDSLFTNFGIFGINYHARGEFLDYHSVLNQKLEDFNLITRNNNLLAHLGGIGAMQASQTGFQGGFGVSTNQEALICPYALWTNHYQTMQELCRPVNYFEPSGSGCERVKSSEHPNWVTWAQRTHYNQVVSPDRLRRRHSGGPSAWSGYDREHDYSHRITNEVLMNGSFLAMDWVVGKCQSYLAGETLPSEKPGWATNGTDNGRDAGRTFMSMVACAQAIDDETLKNKVLDRAVARLTQCCLPKLAQTNPPLASLAIARKIENDIRVFEGRPGWIPWEDSIFICGFYALTAVRRIAWSSIIERVAGSLLSHSYHPTLPLAVNHYRYENGAVWPESEFSNPDKIRLAHGTDYHHWLLAGLWCASQLSPASEREGAIAFQERVLALGNKESQNLWFINRIER